MKNPILFLLVILICSCSSESSKSNQGASISLQIMQDTLLVDSGDEVVMAGSNLMLSVLSEDQGKLFNYDRKSSNLEVPLRSWYHDAKSAEWRSSNELKKQYKNASIVGDGRVVFNIKGNDYRLVVAIDYEFKVIFIRFIGTHKQYDKIDVKTI